MALPDSHIGVLRISPTSVELTAWATRVIASVVTAQPAQQVFGLALALLLTVFEQAQEPSIDGLLS